jgi:hypothetical protein
MRRDRLDGLSQLRDRERDPFQTCGRVVVFDIFNQKLRLREHDLSVGETILKSDGGRGSGHAEIVLIRRRPQDEPALGRETHAAIVAGGWAEQLAERVGG